jgi:hypothetical protein
MFKRRIAWKDFFSTSPTTLNPQKYNSRQTPTDSSLYVLNCLFVGCKSTSEGGALYCGSTTYLLVESSSFFSCDTSSGTGGAIRFSNGNGECVLNKVCGNNCYAPGGQFAYTVVRNTVTSKNYFNYSSIARCLNGGSSSERTLSLVNGKICCPSVNISMNRCYYYSGIICHPFTNSGYVTCSISYSSFADNTASDCSCIRFWRPDANYDVKCCNIIRNTQINLGSQGTIRTDGNVLISDSCIIENKANLIFYSTSSSYTVTLSNCTVDSTTNNLNLIKQNTVKKSFILALNHMSTQNCNAEYDAVGTLVAVSYVSPSTKKEFCFTCKNNHCQARISDLILFTWVMMT